MSVKLLILCSNLIGDTRIYALDTNISNTKYVKFPVSYGATLDAQHSYASRDAQDRRWYASPSMLRLSLALTCLTALMLPGIAYSFGAYDSRNAEECRAQVNANYDTLAADMRAQGNNRTWSIDQRGRAPDLADCDQMERRFQDATMTKAYRRLEKAAKARKEYKEVSAADRGVLALDREKIAKFKPAPYREAYLRLSEEFTRYDTVTPPPPNTITTKYYRCADGDGRIEFTQMPCTKNFTQTDLKIMLPRVKGPAANAHCAAFNSRIQISKQNHDGAVAALTHSTRNWRSLDAQRLAALSDWQLQVHRAKALGCATD